MKNVGGRIRTLRIERKMTLPALAEKSKLSKGLLSKLENAEAPNPSLDTLYRIATALEVTLSEILDSGKIVTKRLVPDSPPKWLGHLQEMLAKENRTVDEDVLQALYVLQTRKGTGDRDDSVWYLMYKNLEINFRKSQ